jgi:DNA ligase-1
MKKMHNLIPCLKSKFIIVFIWILLTTWVEAEVVDAKSPELQLANIYHSDIQLQDYWVSEKLDGVRAYWSGHQFVSKQGNVYQAPEWFTQYFPAFALDGELWLGRAQFDSLSGIVRKQEPIDQEWQKVTYQVFDLPENSADFDERLAYLTNYFVRVNTPTWLKLIPQYKVKNEQELSLRLKEIEENKGEGLMLHKGTSFYHGGRDDDLLKLKTYQDAEARVMGHLPGKGKYEDALGALFVEAVNHVQKGKTFKIGTGFSDLERNNPPDVGSIITYKYFGLTSKGLPRFASFMRIREEGKVPGTKALMLFVSDLFKLENP